MFAERLVKLGYPLAISCFYGLEGSGNGEVHWSKCPQIKFYPKIADVWGSDCCVLHAGHFQADVVFTIQDIWPMDINWIRQIKNWIPIVPIDLEPAPGPVLERLNLAYRIVTFAPYGYEALLKQGFSSTLIPYGVDTNVIKPISKSEARKKMGIPEDIYLFGMIAANKEVPSRKGFEAVMEAFSKFHKKYPKSGIYFHVQLQQPGGFDLIYWSRVYGIEDCMYHVPPYQQLFGFNREGMNVILNTFDCLLNPAVSEGLAATPLEAQACGIPTIVTNFVAMKNIVKDQETGLFVKVRNKRALAIGSFAGDPDENDLFNQMEICYNKSLKNEWNRDKIRQFILDNFDADKNFNQGWIPFLNKLEQELLPPVDQVASIKSNE